MTPDASLLQGLSAERAQLYGLPHLGARYRGERHYRATAERCQLCGRPVGSVHHVAHLKWGRHLRLATPQGTFDLRSPLFALCGHGTSGCHDGFHGGAWLRARWAWDSEGNEAAWWSGELLARYGAHNPALFAYGRWEVENTRTGLVLVRRGEL